MKKYKYQRLSKEEKKEAKLEFYQTEQGIELKSRFNNSVLRATSLFKSSSLKFKFNSDMFKFEFLIINLNLFLFFDGNNF